MAETDAALPMALEDLLESLVSSTGKSKSEILDEWKKALSAISPLRKRLNAASDPKELQPLIRDIIKQYEADSDYMMALSTAIERFIVARGKLEVAAAKVDSIEWKRDLVSMKESLKNSASASAIIERLDSNTKNMYDALADSWIEVSQRRLQALRSSWRTAINADFRLRSRLFFYRYRPHIFRVVFGILLASFITIAYSAAFTALYIGAAATLVLAVIQEYFIGPWLSRLLLENLRDDLKSSLRLLEFATFFSAVHLQMWGKIKDEGKASGQLEVKPQPANEMVKPV